MFLFLKVGLKMFHDFKPQIAESWDVFYSGQLDIPKWLSSGFRLVTNIGNLPRSMVILNVI
jgi:hypothetical protein